MSLTEHQAQVTNIVVIVASIAAMIFTIIRDSSLITQIITVAVVGIAVWVYFYRVYPAIMRRRNTASQEQTMNIRSQIRNLSVIVGLIFGFLISTVILFTPTLDLIHILAQPVIIEGEEQYFYGNTQEPNEIGVDLRFDSSNDTRLWYYQGALKSYVIQSPRLNLPSYLEPIVIKNPSNSSFRYDQWNGFAYNAGRFVHFFDNVIGLDIENGKLPDARTNSTGDDLEFVFDGKPTNGQYPIKITFSYLQSTQARQVEITIDRDYKFGASNVTAFYKIKVVNNESAPLQVREVRLYEYQQDTTYQESVKISIDNEAPQEVTGTHLAIYPFVEVEPHSTSEFVLSFDYAHVN